MQDTNKKVIGLVLYSLAVIILHLPIVTIVSLLFVIILIITGTVYLKPLWLAGISFLHGMYLFVRRPLEDYINRLRDYIIKIRQEWVDNKDNSD